MKLNIIFIYLALVELACLPVFASKIDITEKLLYQENGELKYVLANGEIPSHQAYILIDTVELNGKEILIFSKSSDFFLFTNNCLLVNYRKNDSLRLTVNELRSFYKNGQLIFTFYQPEYKQLGNLSILISYLDSQTKNETTKTINNHYFTYRSSVVGIFWIFILSMIAFVRVDSQVFKEALIPQRFLTKSSIYEISGPRYRISIYHLLSWLAFIVASFAFFKVGAIGSGLASGGYYWTLTLFWIGIHLYMYLSSTLLGMLFSLGYFSRFHLSQSIRISASLTVILGFITAVLYFSQILNEQNFIKWQEAAIYFYVFFRGTNIILSLNKVTSLFQISIISYLCATEWIPLMVLLGIAK